jgi:hypothetical protein
LIANLAHAGTIVDHKSGNFFVAHFAVAELLRNLKSEKSAGNFAERRALTVDKNELAWWMESAFSSAPPLLPARRRNMGGADGLGRGEEGETVWTKESAKARKMEASTGESERQLREEAENSVGKAGANSAG